MGFLLAVLGFVVAEEVVELEPVQDRFTAFNCGAYTSEGQASCETYPFCMWISPTCYNDPCLKVISDDADTDAACGTANAPSALGGGSISCVRSTGNWAGTGPVSEGAYCRAGTPAEHQYCHYPGLTSYSKLTSCAYEYIKSGNSSACDPYFCVEATTSLNAGTFCYTAGARDPSNCADLVTAAYCKLNPHCYWNNPTFGTASCLRDTCTDYSGSEANCDTHYNTNNGDAPGRRCSSIEVYDGSSSSAGTTKILCVDPDKNPSPNKCFDLGEAYHPSSGSGACLTYTLPRCAANEECNAQVGTTGPFAAYYCGDKDHTSPDASVLVRIPAFLILLLVALFVL